MPDGVPAVQAGKGRRVLGTFVLMLGAGLILDLHAVWVGVPVMLVGAIAFAWGMAESWSRDAAVPRIVESTET